VGNGAGGAPGWRGRYRETRRDLTADSVCELTAGSWRAARAADLAAYVS
jgi:hypothetical protein